MQKKACEDAVYKIFCDFLAHRKQATPEWLTVTMKSRFNISEIIDDSTAKWHKYPPASSDIIDQLIANSPAALPEAYLFLLQTYNGGEGELAIEPGWFQLWSAEEVLKANQAYNVENFIPGFWGFGSSGGGELLAFDMLHSEPWRVVMILFIPMDKQEAVVICKDFLDFVKAMGHELIDDSDRAVVNLT